MGQSSVIRHHSQRMASHVHVKVFQAKDDCTGLQVCGTVSFFRSGNCSAPICHGMEFPVLLHLGQDASESTFASVTFQPISFPDLGIGQDRGGDEGMF